MLFEAFRLCSRNLGMPITKIILKAELKKSYKRLLNMENKQKVTGGVVGGGWAKWVRGIKE